LIRKYSFVNSLGLNLNAFPICSVFDYRNHTISKSKVIEIVNQRNGNYFGINPNAIEQINTEIEVPRELQDYLEITQGHDFINCFKCFCKRNRGSEPSPEHIQSSLRCSFSATDFRDTDLYSCLKRYSDDNSIDIFNFRT